MSVVVTFRRKEATEVIGTYDDHDLAIEGATKFLKNLNVDEEELTDELGEGWSWQEVIERWDDLSDGYEDFTFTET